MSCRPILGPGGCINRGGAVHWQGRLPGPKPIRIFYYSIGIAVLHRHFDRCRERFAARHQLRVGHRFYGYPGALILFFSLYPRRANKKGMALVPVTKKIPFSCRLFGSQARDILVLPGGEPGIV